MSTLYLDTETFSSVPLRRGHHAYFASPDAQIMIATWAVDDGPVQIEDLTEITASGGVRVSMPSDELLREIEDADEIVIQNSPFDRTGIAKLWGVDIPIGKVFDTMACAMAHSLPGALGALCTIMGVSEDEAKEDGKDGIRLFCVPRPKNVKLRRATKATHPEEWKAFLHYAGMDIPSMRSLRQRLPTWNYRNTNQHRELDLWRLDQKINERGFRVDLDLAHKAMATIGREQDRLAAETKALTKNEVDKATRRDDMLVYIFVEYGVYLPDLKKDTLERRLEDPEIPDALKQLIRVRLATSTSSTAKYKALDNSSVTESKGVQVLRGTTKFCGALRTGRWSGSIFQPQNLPRPRPWFKVEKQAAAIAALKADCLDLVDDDPMRTLSDLLRNVIVARPGRLIFASDLSNIEGRTGCWLAGEQWKLDAYAEIDKAKREERIVADMYQRAYGEMFDVDPMGVGGDERQVGKVSELANAYEGGVGAALAFAAVYRLNLDKLAEKAYPLLPRAARDQAEIMWDWRERKKLSAFGLSRRTFVVFETFKSLWRAAHPAHATYWGELDKAAKEAVRYPGQEIEARKLAFQKKGAWLRMILPSGRVLCYPSPQIKEVGGKETLTYLGVASYGARKWTRTSTYGGKLFENANQATARDVMAFNMPEIEDAGFEILLTVHDEVITEADEDSGLTVGQLSAILAKNPPWLAGCPLAASGFESDRYRKD